MGRISKAFLSWSLAAGLLLACASEKKTNMVKEPGATPTSAGREAATAAISRAEVFEAQLYAPEQLQQAYDFLEQGDATTSEDKWKQSKVKADEATGIAAPLAGGKWLDQLEEGEQALKDLRGSLYMPDYYSSLTSLVDQARAASEKQDWDLLLGIYQKTAKPLAEVVAVLDANLSWLNQLKKETEGILGEANRKKAKQHVPALLATAQKHYNTAIDNLEKSDLALVEEDLLQSRHFGRETLRLLDLAVNLKDVDGQINRQGTRITQTVGSLPASKDQPQKSAALQSWSSKSYLQSNPLVEISMEPREYEAETSQLQQPQTSLDALALLAFPLASPEKLLLLPIVSMVQPQLALIAQQVDETAQMDDNIQSNTLESNTPGGESGTKDDGLALLEKSRDAWQKAVEARNGGDLDKARYYLEESSRHLNNYTSQYSVQTLYTVKNGDCLWRIAGHKSVYGDPYKWPYIYLRNRDLIANPNLIYPGQKFIIPVIDYDIPNIKQIIQEASDSYENSSKRQ